MNIGKKTILVVEDEAPLQQAIQLMLTKNGLEVVSARTALQAMEYAEKLDKIDAIWLDHYLFGKENGLDFLAWCREKSIKCKEVPIYVVTNTASSDQVKSYMKLGAKEYFVKSDYSLDQIIQVILKELGSYSPLPGQKSILIVEDDFSQQNALADRLKQEGYSILTESNGQEGLKSALQNHPDFILLDIMMPIMDGQTMLTELRKDTWGASAKVAMLTNVNDNKAILESLQNHEIAFYIKSDTPIMQIVTDIKNFLASKT